MRLLQPGKLLFFIMAAFIASISLLALVSAKENTTIAFEATPPQAYVQNASKAIVASTSIVSNPSMDLESKSEYIGNELPPSTHLKKVTLIIGHQSQRHAVPAAAEANDVVETLDLSVLAPTAPSMTSAGDKKKLQPTFSLEAAVEASADLEGSEQFLLPFFGIGGGGYGGYGYGAGGYGRRRRRRYRPFGPFGGIGLGRGIRGRGFGRGGFGRGRGGIRG